MPFERKTTMLHPRVCRICVLLTHLSLRLETYSQHFVSTGINCFDAERQQWLEWIKYSSISTAITEHYRDWRRSMRSVQVSCRSVVNAFCVSGAAPGTLIRRRCVVCGARSCPVCTQTVLQTNCSDQRRSVCVCGDTRAIIDGCHWRPGPCVHDSWRLSAKPLTTSQRHAHATIHGSWRIVWPRLDEFQLQPSTRSLVVDCGDSWTRKRKQISR